MRWHLFAIGKPKLDYARRGIEEYAARIKPFVPLRIDFLKAPAPAEEGSLLLDCSKGMFRVVLDERGEQLTSRALATKLSQWEIQGPRDFALLIGGADGHTDCVREAAAWRWSLSRLTFQHELALLIALEQLYRAYSIKAGLPYHRD
jgi:23S rRNA (pseudouridine1915-N3)-methyltransferase